VQMTSVANEGGPSEVDAMLSFVRDRFVEVFGYSTWSPMDDGVTGEVRA